MIPRDCFDQIEGLRDRLFLLTGCGHFGGSDGTVGFCVECGIDRPDMHKRCRLFQDAYNTYRMINSMCYKEDKKESE